MLKQLIGDLIAIREHLCCNRKTRQEDSFGHPEASTPSPLLPCHTSRHKESQTFSDSSIANTQAPQGFCLWSCFTHAWFFATWFVDRSVVKRAREWRIYLLLIRQYLPRAQKSSLIEQKLFAIALPYRCFLVFAFYKSSPTRRKGREFLSIAFCLRSLAIRGKSRKRYFLLRKLFATIFVVTHIYKLEAHSLA